MSQKHPLGVGKVTTLLPSIFDSNPWGLAVGSYKLLDIVLAGTQKRTMSYDDFSFFTITVKLSELE